MSSGKTFKKEYLLKIFILIYSLVILYSNSFTAIIVLICGFFVFLLVYLNFEKIFSLEQILIILLCIFAPTSFVSIIGTSYGQLPITFFHIVGILLILKIISRKFEFNFFFILILLFLSFSIASLFLINDKLDALKQIFTITFFLFTFFIASQTKTNKELNQKIREYYIFNVIVFAIIIFLQKFSLDILGYKVGYYMQYAGREVFAGYMSDFSFATIFLATGATLVLIDIILKNKEINLLIKNTSYIVLFLLAMLLINSRTGLYAFLASSAIFLLLRALKGNVRSVILIIIGIIITPIILEQVFILRGGQSLFDVSGRTYNKAIELFINNPLMGVGLGLGNLKSMYGLTVPHNLFVQYLSQMGLIGSLIFATFFIVTFLKYRIRNNEYVWVLLTIFLSSMAIPDIVSSRFLSIIIILFIFNSKKT